MAKYTLDDLPLRRVPAQNRSREKVSRALEAADRLLDERGVEALNLTQVAQAAGVSVGALHQYLPDRDAIIEVLAARYHQRLEALMAGLLTAAPDTGDIGSLLDAVAAIYRDEATTRSLRLGDGGTASRAHKERMADLLRQSLIARGLTSAEQADARARTLFFAADGVLKEAFRRTPQGDPAMLSTLRDILESWLTPRVTNPRSAPPNDIDRP